MWRLFRPITLYNYVVWEYLRTFGIALAVCLVICILVVLIGNASELEEFGVSYEQMIPLTPYFLPMALTLALPTASMIAAVLFFGRMAAENEMQAAQSGGVSLKLMVLPALFCGLVFSAVSLWCSDVGIAWGFASLRDEVTDINKPKVLARIGQPGNSLGWRSSSGANVRLDLLPAETYPDGEPRHPIHVAYFNQGVTQNSLFARHFEYRWVDPEVRDPSKGPKLVITLLDGQSLRKGNLKQVVVERFDKLVLEMSIPTLSDSPIRWGKSSGTVGLSENKERAQRLREDADKRIQFLNARALDLAASAVSGAPTDPMVPLTATASWAETQRALDIHESADLKIRKLMVEYHRKLAISFLPFSMAILGIGFGLLVRKSDRLIGFVLGLLVSFVVCYPVITISKELASMGFLPPEALWSIDALAIGLGLGLWYAYEHGYLAGGVPKREQTISSSLLQYVIRASNALRPLVARLTESRLFPTRHRVDRHLLTQFISPLLVLCVAMGAFAVVLDLAEHGGEVVEGVRKAAQPLQGLEARSTGKAVVDVFVYYAIRSLGMIFHLIPLVLLISALLVVYNMVRDNEHLILKSSGTRLQRAFMPLLVAALGLSLLVTALRELVMPELILERDRLKPLVYHRGPRPKSITGTARDADGQTFVFEIARYESSRHLCEGVRLYFPGKTVAGRLVRMEADAMQWDPAAEEWILKTEVAEGGTLGIDSQGREVRYADYGLQHFPEQVPGDPQDDPVRYVLNPVNRWTGQLTPSFIDSQEVGPSVVRATELWSARYRPEFRAELWRRACDWLTGFVLVLGCIPLLLGREGSSRGAGILLCIVYGATYLVLSIAIPELARSGLPEPFAHLAAPAWIPVLPHVLFLVFGGVGYFRHMET